MASHPLLNELAEIDSALLSAVTTVPPDPLSPREKILTRAYLLLAHAVLEERIESMFLAYFRNARQLISSGGPLPVELLSFYAAVMEWGTPVPPTYVKRSGQGFISSRLADEHVADALRKNHGLKEENVSELAKLVGIEWSILDDAPGIQMSSLSTLGVKRGTAGHTSPFSGLDKALDGEDYPVNVREWVHQAAASVIELQSVMEKIVTGGSTGTKSS